ncbi:hypothetical protein GCM10010441_18040 [Kitasatospora paracochleata]|uniref:Uncharacterized protein n=1 Tax=Kitasatospora paracochleata TaxID=58354 RepID=A0ABT1J9N1_9ACTN|nr:hypothetical protein [Kitasatospora paracochleata]MCP2314165.1 hypothetical protein [Kitasatospora paracochleata]
MAVRTTYLSKTEVQDLLGVSSFGMWRLPRQHENFPAPVENDNYRDPLVPDPGPRWDGTRLYTWAAATSEFQHRGALLNRPLPGQRRPGQYLGYRDTKYGPATDWHTTIGTIRVLHTTRSKAASAMAIDLAADRNREIATVCALYGDIGHTGPALVAADTAHPRIEYEAQWGRVADLAGQSLPWWPRLLCRPDVIRQWAPGSPAVVAAVPVDDREQTLRRAAENPVFARAARSALTAMADAIRNQRIDGIRSEIRIYTSHSDRLQTNLVVAARPDDTAHPIAVEEDEEVLRRGWRQIVTSTQPDAVAAADIALGYQPELLPYGHFTEVPAKPGTVADRWARRLTICDPTAGHATLAEGKEVDDFFIDPLTDMPVVRTKPDDGKSATWLFYAPLSLPAGRGELASVTLHDTLWITTTDGQTHPAPCTTSDHLWWGDGWGDRPTEAAHVINQLLDNPTTPISLDDHGSKAPAGLTALLNEDHKQGTELNRAKLLHARMTPPKSAN